MSEVSILQKAKLFLARRKSHYCAVFAKDDASTDVVLRDLAKFCRSNETTFHTDPRLSAVLEGRREVWLRISHHLQLTDEQLWKIYGKNSTGES